MRRPPYTNERGGPTYTVSGSRSTQNLMLFDGLMWNNLFYNTGIAYPPHEALQEISVLLNNYTAQYGRNSGSIFNVLTKSGTNSFHGTVWDYVHNTHLDSDDYFVKQPEEDRQNQVGLTFGGPIKKDKAFFFFSVQDLFAHKQAIGTVQPFNNCDARLRARRRYALSVQQLRAVRGQELRGLQRVHVQLQQYDALSNWSRKWKIGEHTEDHQSLPGHGRRRRGHDQQCVAAGGPHGNSPCDADLTAAQSFENGAYKSSPPAGDTSLNNFPFVHRHALRPDPHGVHQPRDAGE